MMAELLIYAPMVLWVLLLIVFGVIYVLSRISPDPRAIRKARNEEDHF